MESALDVNAGDVEITTLPIFVLANLASGVTTILPDADMRAPAKAHAAPIIRQIHRYRPSRIVGSPGLLSKLASRCLDRKETLDGLAHIFTGGGPVTPRLLDRLAAAAPVARIRGVYGSTEAEPIALVDHASLGHAERSATRQGQGLLAGVPVRTLDVRIIADRCGRPLDAMTSSDFHQLCTPTGEPGEIVVSGDHVLPGYLHGHGDSETKFIVDGQRWHRTGDAGYLDGTGRLWLLGRCNAAIRDAAGTLYPFAVEAVAEDHPDVERAALLAHAGRRVLVIQPRTRRVPALLARLQGELEWAALDEIRIQRIPVDPRHNAKVDYRRLRASYLLPAASFTMRMGGPQRCAVGAISNTTGPAAS
jgi:acyl-CoA synthetase (AMP-forming)/AMP-acid ligase II